MQRCPEVPSVNERATPTSIPCGVGQTRTEHKTTQGTHTPRNAHKEADGCSRTKAICYWRTHYSPSTRRKPTRLRGARPHSKKLFHCRTSLGFLEKLGEGHALGRAVVALFASGDLGTGEENVVAGLGGDATDVGPELLAVFLDVLLAHEIKAVGLVPAETHHSNAQVRNTHTHKTQQ